MIGITFKGLEGRTFDNRNVITGIFVGAEEFTDFHFDELEEFLVVDLVRLVHEYNKSRNANLTGEQDVLTGLRHRAVCC